MDNTFAIGRSGMQAAQSRLERSAGMIARAGAPLSTPASEPEQPSFDDGLAEQLVAQRQAQHLFTANLRTVQTADRMLGSLLDTFA